MGCSVRLEGRAVDCMRIPGKDLEQALMHTTGHRAAHFCSQLGTLKRTMAR